MIGVFSNTRTLTGKLALFFTAMSCAIGIIVFLLFYFALQWSEDRVGERRILIDRDSAVERYIQGETGKIDLDSLTTAYNNLSLLPDEFRTFLKGKDTYLSEVGPLLDPEGYMIYKGYYSDKGVQKDIVVLSLVDEVEFGTEEMLYAGIVAIGFIAGLMFIFGTFLYKVSRRLIEPVNDIANQLIQSSGDTSKVFNIGREAANEFQLLTARLNQYREELSQVLKREQAFARYASHELRTPLTIVKGANSLLSREHLNETQLRQVERIDRAVLEMTTMVDALLSVVKYESNTQAAQGRTVEKAEIERIVEVNAYFAREKKLTVSVCMHGTPAIKASVAVLNMVVGNLFRNACAASSDGSIDIIVSEHSIEVIDDGKGLLEQKTEHESTQGHGLGLLIVNDFCQRFDWRFSLKNHPSRGGLATIAFDNENREQ